MNFFEQWFYRAVFKQRDDAWLEQTKLLGRTPLSLSYPIPEARGITEEEFAALKRSGKISPTAIFSWGVHPRVDGIPDSVSKKLIALEKFYYFINNNYWLMRSKSQKKLAEGF